MSTSPGQSVVRICSSQKSLRVPRKKIERLISFISKAQDVATAEIDVAVVTSDEITELNERYLGRSEPTDVLSFDLTGSREEGIRAQIVVCGDVAVAEARGRNKSPQLELLLYVAHALLHLMGYDDVSPSEAEIMHARESKLLDAFLRN